MTSSISIGGRLVGPGEPVYVVAEIAANHDGRLDEAMRLVGAAKRAGADAVGLGSPLPPDWLPELAELVGELELDLVARPDDGSPELFAELEVAAYEMPAAAPALVRRLAAGGRPIWLSVGPETPETVAEAMAAARDAADGGRLALLWRHGLCPAPAEELHLRTIPLLAQTFGLPVGFGDHTLGDAATVAAVALGAAIVGKHLTLSRALSVAESAISLEPEEFRRMVTAVRTAESALGEQLDLFKDR